LLFVALAIARLLIDILPNLPQLGFNHFALRHFRRFIGVKKKPGMLNH
jgi:hypothetical protein